MTPAVESSRTMFDTVAAERPVMSTSSICARLPCVVSASTIRCRFASRSDACEPGGAEGRAMGELYRRGAF
jgi:hypothetical protein